jgi:hypothetical protein
LILMDVHSILPPIKIFFIAHAKSGIIRSAR